MGSCCELREYTVPGARESTFGLCTARIISVILLVDTRRLLISSLDTACLELPLVHGVGTYNAHTADIRDSNETGPVSPGCALCAGTRTRLILLRAREVGERCQYHIFFFALNCPSRFM